MGAVLFAMAAQSAFFGPSKYGIVPELVDSNQLSAIALKEGMETLRKSGGDLVRRGITSTAEVLRVTRGAGE